MKSNAAIWIGAGMVLWYGFLRGVRAVKVYFDKLRVVSIAADGIIYRISLAIHNPLLIDVVINDIQGKVYIMDTHVATIDYPVNQRIRSFGTSVFDIQFEAYSDKIGAALWQNIQTGDVHTLLVTFDGYVTVKGVNIHVKKQFTYDDIFRS